MKIKVWDIFIRFFHWSLVGLFAANIFVVDDESKVHHYVGYAILALLIARILWGIVGSQYARFINFPPSLSASFEQATEMVTSSKSHKTHIGHTPLGALMIYNIIITLLVIIATGYLMTTDMFWGIKWPEEVHEIFVSWAEISVVLHILAIFYESHRSKINLPLSMITGYKNIKADEE